MFCYNPLVIGLRVVQFIACRTGVIFCVFQANGGEREASARGARGEEGTIFLFNNKSMHFFCFSFIAGTFGNKRRASRIVSSTEQLMMQPPFCC